MDDILVKVRTGSSDLTLLFFPFLGGSFTSFNRILYEQKMDATIYVINPPGHGGSKMKFSGSMDEAVRCYAGKLKEVMTSETFFFGHSMGGLTVYHLTKYLIENSSEFILPKAVVISASGPGKTLDRTIYSDYSDEALTDRLFALGAMPDDFRKMPYLQELFVPIFRSDYRIMESVMDYEPDFKLDIPAYVICGGNDAAVPLRNVLRWNDYFKNPLKLHILSDAEHMFINDRAKDVVRFIEDAVRTELGQDKFTQNAMGYGQERTIVYSQKGEVN